MRSCWPLAAFAVLFLIIQVNGIDPKECGPCPMDCPYGLMAVVGNDSSTCQCTCATSPCNVMRCRDGYTCQSFPNPNCNTPWCAPLLGRCVPNQPVKPEDCGPCPADCPYGLAATTNDPSDCQCTCASSPCHNKKCPRNTVCQARPNLNCAEDDPWCPALLAQCVLQNKPGTCPKSSHLISSSLSTTCSQDSDCSDDSKCCSSSTSAKICTRPCSFMTCKCFSFMESQNYTNSRGCTSCKCVPKTAEIDTVCALPKEIGIGYAAFKRYYYDNKAKRCRPFTYSGLGGNKNQFATLELCQLKCVIESIKSNHQITENQNPICQLDKAPGLCMAYFERFFFNKHTKQCEQFVYGGCQGNENNFESLEKCNSVCGGHVVKKSPPTPSKDLCKMKKDVGPCMASIQRYFYNQNTGRCDRFYYGGCLGNANNFESESDCYAVCGKTNENIQPPVDKCKLVPEAGMCLAAIERYFYNVTSQQCDLFLYGGCGGNQNNFETKESCMQDCGAKSDVSVKPVQNVCSLKADVGPCRAALPRFFYNSATKQCESFIYGGCDGNENNFETEQACKNRCGSESSNTKRSEEPRASFCSLPKETGPCRALMPRFYFNPTTSSCEQFNYGGCDGNDNNFLTEAECKSKCRSGGEEKRPVVKATLCSLPKETGPCRAMMHRFFFNPSTNKCEQFVYGGCGGNENNFLSSEECQASCSSTLPAANTKQARNNKCLMSKEIGPCEALMPRFFYNQDSGKCEPFNYGGCQGNENNFMSQEECENECYSVQEPIQTVENSKDVCSLDSDSGPCRGYAKMFFYNNKSQTCEEFVYGGCQGNENRFSSKDECDRRCSSSKRQAPSSKLHADCLLDKEPGPCKALFPRFYYNKSSKKCESFNYGGCQGNANRFESESECQQHCQA